MFLFAVADINECTNNTHNCHENANCTNTNGSFTCECVKGFTGDGENCTGIFNEQIFRINYCKHYDHFSKWIKKL